jgi:hypothetical protein
MAFHDLDRLHGAAIADEHSTEQPSRTSDELVHLGIASTAERAFHVSSPGFSINPFGMADRPWVGDALQGVSLSVRHGVDEGVDAKRVAAD